MLAPIIARTLLCERSSVNRKVLWTPDAHACETRYPFAAAAAEAGTMSSNSHQGEALSRSVRSYVGVRPCSVVWHDIGTQRLCRDSPQTWQFGVHTSPCTPGDKRLKSSVRSLVNRLRGPHHHYYLNGGSMRSRAVGCKGLLLTRLPRSPKLIF